MKNITLNPEQQLYVIPAGDGYFSCFGYQNAQAHTKQIADLLGRADLQPAPDEFGTLAGYDKYQRAVAAYGSSTLTRNTFFDPGTNPQVAKLLERYRTSGEGIRLFYGDPDTGRDWCEENDVVGKIGRSTGFMKVPLLVADGEYGGGAILSASIVRLMDVASNRDVYRCPGYQVPNLEIVKRKHGVYTWAGYRDGKLHARFRTAMEASHWHAFLVGDIAASAAEARALQGRSRYAA